MRVVQSGINPEVRGMALLVAGASKAVFIALVLTQGARYIAVPTGIAITIDLVWVVLFAWYLLRARAARA
jgi:hypothetical protein